MIKSQLHDQKEDKITPHQKHMINPPLFPCNPPLPPPPPPVAVLPTVSNMGHMTFLQTTIPVTTEAIAKNVHFNQSNGRIHNHATGRYGTSE